MHFEKRLPTKENFKEGKYEEAKAISQEGVSGSQDGAVSAIRPPSSKMLEGRLNQSEGKTSQGLKMAAERIR